MYGQGLSGYSKVADGSPADYFEATLKMGNLAGKGLGMFWKKKEVAGTGAPGAAAAQPKGEKLPGPKELPFPVGRDIVTKLGKSADWTWSLKAVVRPRAGEKSVFDVRVFSEVAAAQAKVKVQDYTTLDGHPELMLFEGWYNKDTTETSIVEKKAA